MLDNPVSRCHDRIGISIVLSTRIEPALLDGMVINCRGVWFDLRICDSSKSIDVYLSSSHPIVYLQSFSWIVFLNGNNLVRNSNFWPHPLKPYPVSWPNSTAFFLFKEGDQCQKFRYLYFLLRVIVMIWSTVNKPPPLPMSSPFLQVAGLRVVSCFFFIATLLLMQFTENYGTGSLKQHFDESTCMLRDT